MRNDTKPERKVIPPRPGLGHLLDATRYSLGGARRLWRETAAKQEVFLGGVALVALIAFGATFTQLLGFLGLLALLLAVEALNTAIEVMVNHLSPGWSEMAKQAKDLGSLAVGLMVVCTVGYVGAVVFGVL